jgi:predicted TPR repeat methyltransferase
LMKSQDQINGQQYTAAKHMIIALDDRAAQAAIFTDKNYVKDLFNNYAIDYDSHVKKLLFSAPRIIRQEIATIYKEDGKFNFADPGTWEKDENGMPVITKDDCDVMHLASGHNNKDSDCPEAAGTKQDVSGCGIVQPNTKGPLDILDLGCGTGLAGAWLKDYAKTLTGVDMSKLMLSKAQGKGLYTSLQWSDMEDWLVAITKNSHDNSHNNWDLVVAADVLAYIGDLTKLFRLVKDVVRPGGHFVFTVEAVPSDISTLKNKGYRLLNSGRFGYHKSYLDDVLNATFGEEGKNYRVRQRRDFSPRLEAGEPLPGYLFIIEKII